MDEVFTLKEIYEIKMEDDLIDKSIMIVSKLFRKKKDKQGIPYIKHLYFVMNHVDTYEEKIIGLLHDIIEDTYINVSDLKNFGYPENIIQDILLLTYDKTISYDEYINNILKSNNLAVIKVKYADMTHNCDIERLSKLPLDVQSKLNKKYCEPYKLLTKKLKEMN